MDGVLHARILDELEELKSASEATLSDRKPVELDQQSVGRLSRMDALQGQAMADASQHRRQRRIIELEAALRRLEDSEYGLCVECGETIAARRLAIDPAAAKCIHCAAR
ncbi:TraR/DksA family transcriptional regulator [Pelagibacterium montanilacus]|uniref:TraR/DksA family transcriptional regulator n=1 Tax=Pelagibacterium montanilacus TaxID=2185280 RepID=UPI000F8E8525|nr:TraR/DksA C4-type zinc finger protein [Pelagibacterium montanilacus]